MKSHTLEEKILYAKKIHTIKDKATILAYDIEKIKLIQLNDLELRVLKSIEEKPVPISGLKKRFPGENGEKVESVVDDLLDVKLLDHSGINNISRKKIDYYEQKRLEHLKKKTLMQISLNVTHKCNLNCDYCYGGDGSYGGPAVHMDKKTAERAVDFLMKESGDSRLCRITFFGGEPLLNFGLVKHVVKYAKKMASTLKKEMYFNMTTNGVLLDDEKIDFIIKEKIELTFSFDGPKKIQDKGRQFKSNKEKSTYDFVYPKILRFIERAEKHKSFYAFRATITRTGLVFIDELVDFFRNFKTKQVYYDTAEYRNGISPEDLAITDDDLKIYRQKVKKMAAEYKNKTLKPDSDLFSGPLKLLKEKVKKESYCVSPGALYVGVSAEGDIFPCHRFVGCKDTRLGDVWKGFDRETWLKKYANVHVFNSKVCVDCWIRYFCGGLCPATNYFLGGNMILSETVEPEPVHCKLKKIVLEEALLLFASIAAQD